MSACPDPDARQDRCANWSAKPKRTTNKENPMSLRDDLNNAVPGRLNSALQSLQFGELLNAMLAGGDVIVPALTSTQNATAAAVDLATSEALANALKVSYNALQVDVAAIRASLLSAAGVTEAGVTVTTNAAVLANQPKALIAVVGTTGTHTGMKKILLGPITGPKALLPAANQCVWDGGKNVLFAAFDAITVASFLYSQATDVTVSLLQRDIGESDTN
jgi:hypothetical protein